MNQKSQILPLYRASLSIFTSITQPFYNLYAFSWDQNTSRGTISGDRKVGAFQKGTTFRLAGTSDDNTLVFKIVLKISPLPSQLRFLVN